MTDWLDGVVILIVYLVVHSYFIYPISTFLFSKLKKQKVLLKDPIQEPITVLIAARNEESVIEEKILSILEGNYPLNAIQILVGSDASTDKTDAVLTRMAESWPQIRIICFKERKGKSEILNALKSEVTTDWIVSTDANVLLHPDALFELMHTARSKGADLVGAHIQYQSLEFRGVAWEEGSYLKFENMLKQAESDVFGLVIGIEGGCYLIRTESFPLIPGNALVDDFYVNMHVLSSGGKTAWCKEARCVEDNAVEEEEEFRRKVRISRGNFQNLMWFREVFLKRFILGYTFLSHKVLRWFTPHLMLMAVAISLYPAWMGETFSRTFVTACAIVWVLVIGPVKNSHAVKSLRHFYLMNFALLKGFILYTKNQGEYVWEPTKRKQ